MTTSLWNSVAFEEPPNVRGFCLKPLSAATRLVFIHWNPLSNLGPNRNNKAFYSKKLRNKITLSKTNVLFSNAKYQYISQPLYLTWSCCSIQQCWVLFFLRYYLPWSRWLLFPVVPLPSGSIHLLHWLLSLYSSLECQYFLRYLSNTPFYGFNHYLVLILPISIHLIKILFLSSNP